MTYFLNGGDAPVVKAQNPDADITGVFGGIGAAWDKAQIENNSNFRLSRERRNEEFDLAQQAAKRIGIDALNRLYDETGPGYDHLRPAPDTIEGFLHMHGMEADRMILDYARDAAANDPAKWGDIDLSEDGIDARINARLQAEHEDAEQILDMMPGGRGAAEIVGAIGGITADIKNLPFLLLGGGSGSLLRVMGREAAINMAAEGAFLSDQFEMAERLNIPDPDVRTQLLMAAAGGAVFGGLIEGGSRALTYWRGRNTVMPISGYDSASTDAMVTAAEEALVANQNPLRAVQEAVAGTEPKPYILENPINPDKPPLITTERLPPVEGQTPLPVETIEAQAEAALDEIATARMGDKKPFTKKIRSDVKVHPDGPLAQELKAQGITAKSYPGLFSRKGAKDLDNLVASEWDDAIPGISRVTGTDGLYLSRQGVIDALVEENAGRRLPTDKEVDLQLREADVAASKRSPQEDFLSGADSGIEGRLYIDRNDLGFLTDKDVAGMVDGWLAERGWTDIITPQERNELLYAMQTNGGDAEYLIERMWERDLDYAALPPREAPDYDDVPFGQDEFAAQEAVGPGVGTGGRSDADTIPARGGGEGLADDAGQARIPGTDRIDTGLSQRQKAEIAARQQQSKIGRLDQTRIEDTEGTLFGGAQSDLFSDPASPQARPILDDISASIRDDILKDGDFKLDLGDGKGERSVSSILDDLDEGDEFADILDLCGKPMVKE